LIGSGIPKETGRPDSSSILRGIKEMPNQSLLLNFKGGI
jgi:hypothetical protein